MQQKNYLPNNNYTVYKTKGGGYKEAEVSKILEKPNNSRRDSGGNYLVLREFYFPRLLYARRPWFYVV